MAQKNIYEYDAKMLLAKELPKYYPEFKYHNKLAIADCDTDLEQLIKENPWIESEKVVVKPDQLFGKRGKANLLLLDANCDEMKQFCVDNLDRVCEIGEITGQLKRLLIEPFIPHEKEYYVSITSDRENDIIHFSFEGGIFVEENWDKVVHIPVALGTDITTFNLEGKLPDLGEFKDVLIPFIKALFQVYVDQDFAFLEINPFAITEDKKIVPLDVKARLDDTAIFLHPDTWGNPDNPIEFPAGFGQKMSEEEAMIHELDEKTGASLKLTILNRNGRIWTMVAGGGASVIYTDTVVDLGFGKELGNYGEYSGNPSREHTEIYAQTIIDLITEKPDPNGKPKYLIIGGGIANFTDVKATFTGIVSAIKNSVDKLKKANVKIYVRRGGPNEKQGLELMKQVGEETGIPIDVYDRYTHMTRVVELIKKKEGRTSKYRGKCKMDEYELFDRNTQAIIYGLQANAIQRMLDFDYICKREKPSVAGVINPTQDAAVAYHKAFWGSKEIVVPVYKTLQLANKNHPNADVMVNFASFRSAYPTSKEALESDTIRTVAIIAEGMPERQTRHLIKIANERNKVIIGPATVGGIKAGAFKIGNAAGTIENITLSKLYRPGSVGFVSKSGGLSNEMNFMISQTTDGIYEGIAIGGDRYPGSQLIDHLLRYEANPNIKMLVALGEIGGKDEYAIVDAIKSGKITKPLVIWVAGTGAGVLPSGLQFGHAGAMAGSDMETAKAKNVALRKVGAIVPDSYEDLDKLIKKTFEKLVKEGKHIPVEDFEPPKLPIDFTEATRLGLVRRPTDVIVTISDDRGEIVTFNQVPLDKIIRENKSIGYVIGLLWFKRELPEFAQQYIEMVIKLTADHGPAVSGAHNAIVSARAGKDLMSALASGILTIGPRFGGAVSDAAKYFREAMHKDMQPVEFVDYMKQVAQINIPGIGHRVKSVQNPDMRVVLLKEFILKNFPKHPHLDYALEVEKVTTSKRNNLILNVDGCIGITFLDLLENLDYTKDEIEDVIFSEALNGLFVLGRSIGMMGHIFDQKRQRAGLYRQPYDEILFSE